MPAHRTTSPDGLSWTIRLHRLRLPEWPQSQYEPSDDAGDDILGAIIAYLIVAPVLWFVVPLFVLVAKAPAALVSSVFSSTRWIRAESDFPTKVTIEWKVDKHHAADVTDEIARRLAKGYENLTPANAQLVQMSEPPGFKDR